MNDIKLSELGNIDYIPRDGELCFDCKYYGECPYDYVCPSMNRLIEFETENGEL